MTTTTELKPGRIVVDADAPREVWMDERSVGVTASVAKEIATGGRSVWEKQLDTMLNGSTWFGNADTDRGHRDEDDLIAHAATIDPTIEANSALWAHADSDDYRATPDGVGEDSVAEVKSLKVGEGFGPMPAEHFAQMQWQMFVLGKSRALYVRKRDDGQGGVADLDAQWVERDDDYIEFLKERADAFIAWRDADCPEFDDVDDVLGDLIQEALEAKQGLAAPAARDKKAAAALKKALEARSHSEYGVTLTLPLGEVKLTAASRVLTLDEEAIPDHLKAKRHAKLTAAKTARDRADELEQELVREYGVTTLGTSQSLRITTTRSTK